MPETPTSGPSREPASRRAGGRRGGPDPAPAHLGRPADPPGAGARRVRRPARRRQADRGPRRRARPGLVAQEAGRARADRRTPAERALRKEDAELDDRLDKLNVERDVRREVEDFNERVIRARYQLPRARR